MFDGERYFNYIWSKSNLSKKDRFSLSGFRADPTPFKILITYLNIIWFIF